MTAKRNMTAKPNTPDGDRLDVLVTLVEAWERKHYRFDLPDPVEAIKYHMDHASSSNTSSSVKSGTRSVGQCPTTTCIAAADDRSIRAFAVKPRAFGAPLRGFGA